MNTNTLEESGSSPKQVLNLLDSLQHNVGWKLFIKDLASQKEDLVKFNAITKWEGDGISNLREAAIKDGMLKEIYVVIDWIEKTKRQMNQIIAQRENKKGIGDDA